MKMRCVMSLAAALCCSGLAASVQAAENCVDASLSPVTVGTTTGNFTGSTNDGPTGCGGTGNLTQWFEFIPANSGKYTISMCGSAQIDTTLGITLSSALCTGALTYIQCNDDACGLGSQITPTLTAGTAYRLRVASFGAVSGGGAFTLTITQDSVTAPAGDNCAVPAAAAVGSNPGSLVGATNSAFNANSCGGTVDFNDVYYTFTSSFAGSYRFSVCTGDFDAVVSVHTACPVSSAVTNQIASACATSASSPVTGCSLRGASLTTTLTAGQTVLVRVAGASDQTGTGSPFVGFGNYDLNIIAPPPPVANDTCGLNQASFTIPGGGGSATQTIADSAWNRDGAACAGTTGADVYYYFTPTSVGPWRFSTCSTLPTFDSVLSIHTGCPASASNYATGSATTSCNDTGSGCSGDTSTFDAPSLTIGTTYVIRVARFSGATAATPTLTVTLLSQPGACCNLSSGVCTVVQGTACTGVNFSYQGDGTTCPNVNCPVSGSCCIVQCCAVLTNASCNSIGGTWTSGGTCLAGSCTDPVPNDECTTAAGLAVGVPKIGSNCGATVAVGEPVPSCGTGGASVWYAFTPATTGFYDATTCGANFDSIINVISSPDCVTWTILGCDDDDVCTGATPVIPGGTVGGLASLISAVQLTGGQQYYIRITGFGTATGTFRVLVSENTVAGACCDATTGACTVSLTGASGCIPGSTFLGGVCTPNPCPQPSGACCLPDGSCVIFVAADCTQGGGIFQGPASVCSGALCPVAVGSCCNNTTGVCTYILASSTCSGGTFTAGGFCSPNTCAQPGACCVAGCCSITLQANCTGTWGPANSTCTGGICGTPVNNECAGATSVTVGANLGSNCGATTSFIVTPETQCGTSTGAGGARDVFHIFTPSQSANYTFSTCDVVGFDSTLALYTACPVDGSTVPVACNDDTAGTCSFSTLRSEIPNQLLIAGNSYIVRVAAWGGGTAEGPYVLTITQGAAAGACCTGTSCAIVLGFNCASGYQGDFTTCGPNTCDPLGSCCAVDGSCAEVAQSLCTGFFTLAGVCNPNICPQPNGACCCGSTCTITAPAACVGTNQSFAGPGTTCVPFSNQVPCCRGDYNKSGSPTSVQDIFDFLAGYFAGDACADSNDSGGANSVQDIFDFLSAYFGGC